MKTIIVTGANSGLGLWTTKYLLDLNYRVIMACRNVEKAKKAVEEFPGFDRSKEFLIKEIDLSDFASIHRFADGLEDSKEIYGLDCNAGTMYKGPVRNAGNGIEETFAVNHLGHFLLTKLLLEKHELERIVIVASELHDPKNKAPFARAVFRPVNEMAYPVMKPGKSLKKRTQEFYTTSKLCNILFGYELDRRLKSRNLKKPVLVNSMNPGFMPETNLGRSHKLMERITRPLLKLMAASLGFGDKLEVSARAVVALFDQDTVTGRYFNKFTEIPSSADSYNRDYAASLWKGSEELTGGKFLD
jgi:NAD(P)-dependent dehydrogenase (short-subunit alcohol dehydrogenase family)